jgi:hypothetical protein
MALLYTPRVATYHYLIIIHQVLLDLASSVSEDIADEEFFLLDIWRQYGYSN